MINISLKKAALPFFLLFLLFSLKAEISESILMINQAEESAAVLLEEYTESIKEEINKSESADFIFYNEDLFFVEGHQTSHYMAYAAERRIPFLILNSYSMDDGNLKILSSVYSVPSGSEIQSLSSVGNLELGIERKISFILRRALQAIELSEIEEFPDISTNPGEGVSDSPDHPEPITSDTGSDESVDRKSFNLILSLDGFPIIPILSSGQYLEPGGGAEVFFGFSFPLRRSAFETGISLSWRGFYAEGTYNRTFNSPVTLQAEASLVFMTGKSLSPYVGLSGGLTIYNMKTETGVWVSKTLPAFSAQTGFHWNISDRISIYTGASIFLWIESSLLITAVEPLAGIRLIF